MEQRGISSILLSTFIVLNKSFGLLRLFAESVMLQSFVKFKETFSAGRIQIVINLCSVYSQYCRTYCDFIEIVILDVWRTLQINVTQLWLKNFVLSSTITEILIFKLHEKPVMLYWWLRNFSILGVITMLVMLSYKAGYILVLNFISAFR